MSLQAQIGELTAKHQALKSQIEEELAHPAANDMKIAELKRQKLRIKDEIAELEASVDAA